MGRCRMSVVARLWLVLAAVRATGLGKCPVYPPQPDFDIQRMVGTWYEVERSFYLAEISASCTELHVALTERGFFLITVNTVNRWTGVPSRSQGLGIPAASGGAVFRYKLSNRVPYVLGRLLPGAGRYTVLATDYEHYALIWSCTSLSLAHSDRIWVVGRSRELEARVRARVYAAMAELRLDPDRLILSKNNNCTAAIN